MRGTRVWSVGVAALVASAIVLGLGAPSASASPQVVARKVLATGVVYQQLNDGAYPIRMYVVTFDPGTRATLDGVLSGSQIGSFQRTSAMGTSVGALAAVNGDLNDWPGRPTHQYVSDGTIMQTGSRAGVSFGYRQDEKGATIGHHPLRISATSKGATVAVSSWNTGGPTTDQVVGYSWYGGRYERPSVNQCSARLVAPTAVRWNAGQIGTGRDYTVDAVRCSRTAAMAVDTASSVVLSAKLVGKGATFIKGLAVGATMHIGWSNDSPDAMDVVSGSALIVQGGVVQYGSSCNADLCQRAPRTAVGVTSAGRVIMLVVDGRSSGSVGFTLAQLGKEMKSLGAVNAVNLDGGGSATMWIKGLGVVNHPTDSTGERPVSNALVVLPGADLSEPAPLRPRAAI